MADSLNSNLFEIFHAYVYNIYRVSRDNTKSNMNLYLKFGPTKINQPASVIYTKKKNHEKNIAKIGYYTNENIVFKSETQSIIEKKRLHYPKKIDFNNIKIFGDEFVENNKKKCKIVYNNKLTNLKEFFYIKNIKQNEKGTFNINLILLSTIISMKKMFSECVLLRCIFDLNWDMKYIKNMSYMFNKCLYLHTINYLKKWNTQNVSDMS